MRGNFPLPTVHLRGMLTVVSFHLRRKKNKIFKATSRFVTVTSASVNNPRAAQPLQLLPPPPPKENSLRPSISWPSFPTRHSSRGRPQVPPIHSQHFWIFSNFPHLKKKLNFSQIFTFFNFLPIFTYFFPIFPNVTNFLAIFKLFPISNFF